MNALRIILGLALLAVGLAALIDFETASRPFIALSPDRDVTPFLWQLLRILWLSLGMVGGCLLARPWILRALARLDGWIVAPRRAVYLWRVVLIAAVLRAAVLWLMPFHLWMDYQSYDELGRQWAAQGGYYNGDHLTAYWPPAYPWLLSRLYLLFGPHAEIAVWINLLFGLAIVLLSYLIARDIWEERVARWTALLVACFPSQVFFTNLLASEMLFTPLFLTALWLSLRSALSDRLHWWLPTLAGVCLGLATLTRAISKMYIVVIVIYWLLQIRPVRRLLATTGLGLLGLAVTLTPWMIRNYCAVGAFAVNTNTGINLFIGNQPSSGMGYNQHAANEYDVNDPTREAEIDRETTRRALEYIREEPLSFIKRGLIKTAFFFAVDVDALDYGLLRSPGAQDPGPYFYLALVTETCYLLVLLAGLVGLTGVYFGRGGGRRPAIDLAALTILYWTGIHFVFYGIGRYHFPIVPIIAAFAAVYLTSRRNDRRGDY